MTEHAEDARMTDRISRLLRELADARSDYEEIVEALKEQRDETSDLGDRNEQLRDERDAARAEAKAMRDEQAHDLVAVVAMLDGVDHYRTWLADAYNPDAPAPDPVSAMYRRAHELRARFAGRLFAAGYDPDYEAARAVLARIHDTGPWLAAAIVALAAEGVEQPTPQQIAIRGAALATQTTKTGV